MSEMPKDPRQLILAIQAEAFYRMSMDLRLIDDLPIDRAVADHLTRAVAARAIAGFVAERRLGVAFLAVARAWEREILGREPEVTNPPPTFEEFAEREMPGLGGGKTPGEVS